MKQEVEVKLEIEVVDEKGNVIKKEVITEKTNK